MYVLCLNEQKAYNNSSSLFRSDNQTSDIARLMTQHIEAVSNRVSVIFNIGCRGNYEDEIDYKYILRTTEL